MIINLPSFYKQIIFLKNYKLLIRNDRRTRNKMITEEIRKNNSL